MMKVKLHSILIILKNSYQKLSYDVTSWLIPPSIKFNYACKTDIVYMTSKMSELSTAATIFNSLNLKSNDCESAVHCLFKKQRNYYKLLNIKLNIIKINLILILLELSNFIKIVECNISVVAY